MPLSMAFLKFYKKVVDRGEVNSRPVRRCALCEPESAEYGGPLRALPEAPDHRNGPLGCCRLKEWCAVC